MSLRIGPRASSPAPSSTKLPACSRRPAIRAAPSPTASPPSPTYGELGSDPNRGQTTNQGQTTIFWSRPPTKGWSVIPARGRTRGMSAGKAYRSDESLEPLILVVRGRRVILDVDLARLYGVTTKAL